MQSEERTCSPLAVAVNVGDIRLVSLVLRHLSHIDIERGLTVKAKQNAVMRANIFTSTRLKTPLQYACSLGLSEIVGKLLKEGADPNLVPKDKERSPFTDYGELPLDIVMKPKLYNKHIGLDGLLCKKLYTGKDVDF